MKTLSEQILEAKQKLGELKDKLLAAIKMLEETADEAAEGAVIELTAEVEKLTARICAMEKAEKALGTAATPAESAAPAAPAAPASVKSLSKSADVDNLLGKMAIVEFESKVKQVSKMDVLATRFKGNQALETIVKAAQNPAMSNVAGYAEELTRIAYGQFIDALREASILARVVPAAKQHFFDGATSISVPFRTGSTTSAAGAFRAEGAPIRVGGLQFDSLSLTPKNMGVILSATEEMLRRSTLDLSAYFQSAIIADTAEVLDTIFISATAGTAIQPAGLRNGVAGGDTRAASGTGTVADIITDVKTMVAALSGARMGSPSTRWVMSTSNYLTLSMAINATGSLQFPSVSASNTLAGYPIIASNLIADDVVLLVDFNEVSTAFGAPAFLASNVATIHEEDTTPLPIATVGSPNVVAAPVRSLFQTNSWALRMLLDADWAKLRAAGLVQELTAVAWTG